MTYNEMFEYRDGCLYWRYKPNSRIVVGSRAGRLEVRGNYSRRLLRVGGVHLKEHRVVWEMHNGPIPLGMQIDHIDGVATNNRIENLRLATASQNQENRRGARGTHFCKTRKKWLAKIQVRGKPRTIGAYATEAEAYAAYVQVKRVVHEFCTI